MSILRWRPSRTSIAVVIAAPCLVLAGVGIASASIPSANGTIYGCVKGPDTTIPGDLIVKDDGGTGEISCGSAASEVQWNSKAAAVDVGVVNFYDPGGDDPSCSVADTGGPDTLSATYSSENGCVLSGLPSNAILVATQGASFNADGPYPTVTNLGGGEWSINSIGYYGGGAPLPTYFMASTGS